MMAAVNVLKGADCAEPTLNEPVIGARETVPDTATFWVVAPVLVAVTLPEGELTGAVAAMRTKIVVAETVPPLWVKVWVAA